MRLKHHAIRLAGREYLPFAGWLLSWAVAAIGLGHADAARLFAVFMLARSARALTLMDTAPAMRRRWQSAPAIRRSSLARSGVIEALSLLAEIAVLAVLVVALRAIGQLDAAWMLVILSVGAPARHLLFLSRTANPITAYKMATPWAGLALVGLAVLADASDPLIVLAFGLREWVAITVTLLAPRGVADPAETPVDWREVAAITGTRGRHRLTYRVGKGLLGTVLGPFSGFVARTGRGVGLHRRVDRFVPRAAWPIALLGLGTTAAAVLLQVALAKPATLVASATLLRIGGVAGSVLLWLRYARDHVPDDEDDDDD